MCRKDYHERRVTITESMSALQNAPKPEVSKQAPPTGIEYLAPQPPSQSKE
jgi:hypothetical protein